MKYEKFQQMAKEAEVNASFGLQTFSTGKKQMKLEAALQKINSSTSKDVVSFVLNHFRNSFNLLDKSIRGEAKKRFCAACYDALDRNSLVWAFDSDGTINPNRVVTAIRKNDDVELSKLVSNMVSGQFERFEERKNEERKNEMMQAYCDAMQDELNCYSIAAFLIA